MMRSLATVILVLGVSASAAAQYTAPSVKNMDDGLLVNGVLLASGTEAARTAEVVLGIPNAFMAGANWSKVRVEVRYARAGAGITAVTVTPYCKRAVNAQYARYVARDCSTTQCAVKLLTDSFTVASSSETFMLEYDVRGCQSFKVVTAATGSPDAGDAVSVGIVKLSGN